ncbi:ATP-binding protein [Nocardioides hwasunensis]|uniref:ATP-binding protein n=1 Tax=Nocardioides hwasunensis TaxID=397258 RepID=A0ABR8MBU1_9ACTN|nr:ATP-binding protein [Nocardioides hwasunensis]MBD3913588.1 ATP-binding protein [Nocardioides hwasunensis]
MSQPDRPRPDEVFTPTKIPLADTNVYTKRSDPEKALTRYVQRGQIPVVFGEYGVGKTTVVRRFFREADDAGTVVYVSSPAGKELADVFTVVLEHLDYAVETEISRRTGDSQELGARLVAHGKLATSNEINTKYSLVVTSPTSEALIAEMASRQVTLIIDELHRATPSFREDLVDFMKACRGGNDDYPVIVLIGTTLDAERLVGQDPGIDRFVKELLVEPLTDEEARFIVTQGFNRLQLSVPDHLVETIIRTSAGAPTIVQSVCLDMAEACIARDDTFLTPSDYEAAVRTYLAENGRRLAGVYLKAIEQVGPKKYRKQILLAMAEQTHDFANMEEIRTRVSEQLGDDVPATALSGPLRELKSSEDSILQDVERREGGRVYNLNSFRDPMMKSFIRFMRELEVQGLVPKPPAL